jgi:hypothetical protein
MINQKFKEKAMCAEKNNDKNEKSTASGCCDQMAEMIKNCCPDGIGNSDCFARMKEMKEKFCGQKTDEEASADKQGCCG